MRAYVLALCIIAILLAPACGPTTATPSPAASATTASTDPAIVYERSGGIAGVKEKWSVHYDGRVVAENGAERRLAPEAVATLVAELERAGFFHLNDAYGVGGACRDCFTAVLTLRGATGRKQVTAVLEDPATPANVREMFGRVDRLVRGT